ncbi:alpha/beta hydrolase [Williamsia maris]|uniref:S-formylglutathione hydrolase FrmB n=1 Tax=Williamsia maris TaxID=72806 RepID=A0ABT1HE09_9NOCA|nr:alpha/beta hydrolase family protein [Williamsia maris]MCP2175931.1 S-formylglutathione hydrolase FrmB [Williamsia maris]
MSIHRLRTRLLAGVFAVVATTGLATVVTAGPAEARVATTQVYSAAMKRNIPVEILGAQRKGAPTLYLLDGLRAPNNDNGWLINTDVRRFFANKNVNVAMPFGGAGSFYTDWDRRDPVLGLNKWETFLTRELPNFMANRYNSSRTNNAIAGLSMSGTSALNLASRHPGMYRGVASYSGYPLTTEPGFAQGIQVAVGQVGGNPDNMWGVYPFGRWLENDPALRAAALRGKRVYVSAGTGGSNIDPTKNPTKFAQVVPLEVASGIASRQYVGTLRQNGVNVVTRITNDGTHDWNYWQARLHESWFSVLGPSLGV